MKVASPATTATTAPMVWDASIVLEPETVEPVRTYLADTIRVSADGFVEVGNDMAGHAAADDASATRRVIHDVMNAFDDTPSITTDAYTVHHDYNGAYTYPGYGPSTRPTEVVAARDPRDPNRTVRLARNPMSNSVVATVGYTNAELESAIHTVVLSLTDGGPAYLVGSVGVAAPYHGIRTQISSARLLTLSTPAGSGYSHLNPLFVAVSFLSGTIADMDCTKNAEITFQIATDSNRGVLRDSQKTLNWDSHYRYFAITTANQKDIQEVTITTKDGRKIVIEKNPDPRVPIVIRESFRFGTKPTHISRLLSQGIRNPTAPRAEPLK